MGYQKYFFHEFVSFIFTSLQHGSEPHHLRGLCSAPFSIKLCFLQLQKFIDYEIGGKYFIISLYTFKVRFLYFFVLVKLSWQCILIALIKCVKSCSLKLFLECLCLLPCHWLFNSSLDTVRFCLLLTLIKCLTVSNCLTSLWDCSLIVYFRCIYKE